MLDMHFFYAAIIIMLIVLVREFLRKRYNFDMDNVEFNGLKTLIRVKSSSGNAMIKKTTGTKTLVMVDAGTNKAVVMATLRQITGVDYNVAKNLVNNLPSILMSNVSEKEADLTKKALEFVGAKIEVR